MAAAIKTVTVIGGGLMGSGIAQVKTKCCILLGIRTRRPNVSLVIMQQHIGSFHIKKCKK
jgi:3-hydroxyacyl-CoA dehydrogenase